MGGRIFLIASAAWSGSFLVWWSIPVALVIAAAAIVPVVVWREKRLQAAIVLVALLAGAATASIARLGATPPQEVVGERVQWAVHMTSVVKPVKADSGQPTRVMFTATTAKFSSRSQSTAVSLPVRIFADSSWVPEMTAGSMVTFLGRISDLPPGRNRAVLSALGPIKVVENPRALQAAVAPLRSALAHATASAQAEPASLVAGLAIGDESRQSPQFAESMQRSGLSHLTAVSGGNVAIVLSASLLLAYLIRLGPKARVTLAFLVLLGYVVLVGPQPSVLRAAVMGAAAMGGVMLGGAPRGLPLVGSCVLVLILASPALAVSLGFALSVVATAALVVGAHPLAERCRRLLGGRRATNIVILAGAVTVTAQVATAPLLFAIGAPVSWVSVPANLAAAPLVAPITILGLSTAVVGAFAPVVGNFFGAVAIWFAKALVAIAYWGDEQSLDAASPVLILGLLTILWILWFIAKSSAMEVRTTLIIGMLIVVIFVFVRLKIETEPITDWRVMACDVGQGSAVLLRDGSASAVLVDVGSKDSGIQQCLHESGVEHLTAVVLTHFHEDHYGGLSEVAQFIGISQILVPPPMEMNDGKNLVDSVAREHDIPMGYLTAGQKLELSSANAQVVWPSSRSVGAVGGDDENNSSIVLRAQWSDGFTILTTGDIEPEAQARIQSTYPTQSHDVVVVPHHGSSNQDPRFAEWVNGKLAIVTTGPNTYGHPADETKREYEKSGAIWLRTDQLGTVAVSVREDRLRLSRMG